MNLKNYLILSLLTTMICSNKSFAQMTPFPCSDYAYFSLTSKDATTSPPDDGTTRILRLNMTTGSVDSTTYTGLGIYMLRPAGSTVQNYSAINGIAFNPKNRFIFGAISADNSPYLNPSTPIITNPSGGIPDSMHIYKFGIGGGTNWERIQVDYPTGVTPYHLGLAGTFDAAGYYFNIRYGGGAANSPTNSPTGFKHNYLYIINTNTIPNVTAVNKLHIIAYKEDGITDYGGDGLGTGSQGDVTIDPTTGHLILTVGANGGVFVSRITAESAKTVTTGEIYFDRVQTNSVGFQHSSIWANSFGEHFTRYPVPSATTGTFMKLTSSAFPSVFNATSNDNFKYTAVNNSLPGTDGCACEYRVELKQNVSVDTICNEQPFEYEFKMMNKAQYPTPGERAGLTFVNELGPNLTYTQTVADLTTLFQSIYGSSATVTLTSVDGTNNVLTVTNMTVPTNLTEFSIAVKATNVGTGTLIKNQAKITNIGAEYTDVVADYIVNPLWNDSTPVYVRPLGTTLCPLSISGNVFNDVNGLTDLTVNGPGINNPEGEQLYAYLVNAAGNIVDSAVVLADGSYAFELTSSPAPGAYTVKISTESVGIGNPVPASNLPETWAHTGENVGANAGSDGTVDGINSITIATNNITNINFGIQQVPETVVNVTDTMVAPTLGTAIPVLPNLFTDATESTNPDTEDFGGGTVDSIRFTTFPTGLDSISINGVTYTPSTWPTEGVVAEYTPGTGVSGVEVFPTPGAPALIIPIAAIDNAGAEDPTPGSITIPLKSSTVSGNVFNDANGGNVNLTEVTNIIPSGIYANLIDAAGNVIATVPLNADGSYNFTNVQPGDYTVRLSTNDDATSTADIIYELPAEWVNTGAFTGLPNTGNTGNLTGTSTTFTVTSTDVDNVNFGIEQKSQADIKTHTLPTQPNEDDEFTLNGGSNPPLLSGSDPEDGTYTGNTGTQNNPEGVVITSLPTNGELWYDGVLVTMDDVTDGTIFADPSLFSIKLTGTGYKTTVFEYAYVDAAGVTGSSNTYTLNWDSPLTVNLLSFDAKAEGNTSLLEWTTASEQNNRGFEIQRSQDGNTWTKIGWISSKSDNGMSTSKLDYNYIDNKVASNKYMYRLKQIDLNGKFDYSPVRTVLFTNANTINVYPNPATSGVNIAGLKGDETIAIFDVTGKMVYQSKANSVIVNIPMSSMSDGVYHITISRVDGSVFTTKIVKN